MVTNGQTAPELAAIVAEAIPVSLIDPSPLNRHSGDEDADIAELAQTIEENGLLAPISARPRADGRYEIICGERRWRAYRLLNYKMIPCVVKDLDDTQAQIERIVENYQRRDPSFMEQGEAVAALMNLTDRDVSEVANRLGQSVSWVRRRAKLPNLIPAWRDALAKDNTPYAAIRDSVNKIEEIAVLPPATQQTILDTNVLRHVKTTKEMQKVINKLFMNLEAKPWSRGWEKKAFSGSGKKRCDACMKRSDRENALFADPDAPNTGKKMCLDPECWQNKCLAWCRNLIENDPGIVPIRQGYGWQNDNLDEFFGVKPLSCYDWKSRDEEEAREGYAAAVGVLVDGPDIGTTRKIWLELPGEDEDEADEGVSAMRNWRNNNIAQHREREALAERIALHIADYLANIDTHAAIPAAQLAGNQLRAAAWFGIVGYTHAGDDGASLADPDWNPLAWAWEQTAEHIALHVANVAAEDIAQLHDGDRSHDAERETAATLAAMFAIPLDMIGTKAAEELYKATRNDTHADAEEADGGTAEDSPETDAPSAAISADDLTDPDDVISFESTSHLQMLLRAK